MSIDLGDAEGRKYYELAGKRVFIAGHRGMVGSALLRRLAVEDCEVITAGHEELELQDPAAVKIYFDKWRPDAVVIAAAKVGGILANSTYPVDFLHNNLVIAANITKCAYHGGVEKLLLLGSSCIYPKFSPQPITEEALLTGPLEPTNQWYALAKIAGIKLAQAYRLQYNANFICAMPTNLYGPNDNFDLETAHVIPALMRKAHDAKQSNSEKMTVWGTGQVRREFMHVDDCADALVFLLKNYSASSHINVGTGQDITIKELAEQIIDVVGFKGDMLWDLEKPDGTPRKLMSADRLAALGWKAQIDLRHGLSTCYDWYLANCDFPGRIRN